MPGIEPAALLTVTAAYRSLYQASHALGTASAWLDQQDDDACPHCAILRWRIRVARDHLRHIMADLAKIEHRP